MKLILQWRREIIAVTFLFCDAVNSTYLQTSFFVLFSSTKTNFNFQCKDTLYLENIEERENGGTPPIIQTVRAALAFAVKDYITCKEIEKREDLYINKALKRLTASNPNIEILGNITTKRQAILSFVIYSTTNSSSPNKRGKLLHGPFVATLLNDLFGIQARGGCACAGPYGHLLLNINESQSLAVRSAIQEVINSFSILKF